MQYILIAMVLIVLCMFGLSCRKSTPTQSNDPIPAQAPISVAKGTFLSTGQMQDQLARIAKSPPPKKLALGAMCYDVVGPPGRLDYICPKCYEKTLYVSKQSPAEENESFMYRQIDWKQLWHIQQIEAYRRVIRQIDKLDVTLDESPFCCKCSPFAKDYQLTLVIQYPDQPDPRRVTEFTLEDLLMLKAATDGKLKFKNSTDTEVALKNCLPRLEKLLGVKIEDSKQ